MRDEDRPSVLAHTRFEENRSKLLGLDRAARFSRIHEMNMWGAETSRSGLGSEQDAVAVLSSELPVLLRDLGISSLLDAPCGDGAWISNIELNVDYVGVDIVPALVETLRVSQAAAKERRRYVVADIVVDDLPYADAILCRDCLVHLPFKDIELAIENFRRTGANWLIATTFPEFLKNADCEEGDWRALNMEGSPFLWPKPIALLNEQCDEVGGAYRDKSLGVWRVAELPVLNADIG